MKYSLVSDSGSEVREMWGQILAVPPRNRVHVIGSSPREGLPLLRSTNLQNPFIAASRLVFTEY